MSTEVLLRSAGALIRSTEVLIRSVGALIRSAGALIRSTEVLIRSVGALIRSTKVLIRSPLIHSLVLGSHMIIYLSELITPLYHIMCS